MQAEYEKQQHIRKSWLSCTQGRGGYWPMPVGRTTLHVAYIPPEHMKSIGYWKELEAPATAVDPHYLTFRLCGDDVSAYVMCEGYLVDKWWRKEGLV